MDKQPVEKKDKVVREVAETDFNRFIEAWDIDDNTDAMSGEDKESFDQQKNRILTQIEKGSATVDEEGNISYELRYPRDGTMTLNFKVPSGAAYISMDSYKDRQNIHKMFGFMASMTKTHSKVFSKMDARDAKFCMGVALLFLGS